MASVLGIGDNCVDIYVDKHVQYPGGNAVNVAVYCRRLGLDAGYLGCVGRDELGGIIRHSLEEEGIDLSHMRVGGVETAWSRVRHRNGDRYFDGSHLLDGSSYKLTDSDYRYIENFDLVHTSINSKLEADIDKIAASAKTISFDFSDKFSSAYLNEVAPSVDIAILSAADMIEDDTRQLCRTVSALGPSVVIATRGTEGAVCLHNGIFLSQSRAHANVVDTLGAGDGFIAGFVSAHLRGESPKVSLQLAAQYAADVCALRGAFGHGYRTKPVQPGLNVGAFKEKI